MAACSVVHARIGCRAGRAARSWIGQNPPQDFQVGHVAGQRPDVVERGARNQNARPVDPAEGRFESGDSAIGGRSNNRAAGLRSDRSQAHAQRGGGRRSAARSAGRVLQVPRIAGRRRIDVGEFGGHRLAQHDRAGRSQPGHARRVVGRRRSAGQRHEPARVGSPATSKISLIPSGMPAKGRGANPLGAQCVQAACFGQGALAVDHRPGVHLRLPAIDAAQTFGDQFARFELAGGDCLACFGDGPGKFHRLPVIPHPGAGWKTAGRSAAGPVANRRCRAVLFVDAPILTHVLLGQRLHEPLHRRVGQSRSDADRIDRLAPAAVAHAR